MQFFAAHNQAQILYLKNMHGNWGNVGAIVKKKVQQNKLTVIQVAEIKKLQDKKALTGVEIADIYNVSTSVISRIKKEKTYK